MGRAEGGSLVASDVLAAILRVQIRPPARDAGAEARAGRSACRRAWPRSPIGVTLPSRSGPSRRQLASVSRAGAARRARRASWPRSAPKASAPPFTTFRCTIRRWRVTRFGYSTDALPVTERVSASLVRLAAVSPRCPTRPRRCRLGDVQGRDTPGRRLALPPHGALARPRRPRARMPRAGRALVAAVLVVAAALRVQCARQAALHRRDRHHHRRVAAARLAWPTVMRQIDASPALYPLLLHFWMARQPRRRLGPAALRDLRRPGWPSSRLVGSPPRVRVAGRRGGRGRHGDCRPATWNTRSTSGATACSRCSSRCRSGCSSTGWTNAAPADAPDVARRLRAR